MWLGMLAAAVGQIAWLPVEPLTALAGLLAAYIDQIAAWTAEPSWAQADLAIGGRVALAAVYLISGAGFACGLRWAQRRVGLQPRHLGAAHGARPRWKVVAAAMAALAAVVVASRLTGNGPSSADGGLRVDVLDVGQGDAILLRPPRSPAILVDAGPPDAAVADHLARARSRRARRARDHPSRSRPCRRRTGAAGASRGATRFCSRASTGRPARRRARQAPTSSE